MLTYNDHGYLIPDEAIEIDFETLVKEFVVNDHRAAIFEEYRQMLDELSALSIGSFSQWVDGSFISRRTRPGDIDVVIFIDYQIYAQIEQQLREIRGKYPKVDVYFVKNYPEGHPRRFVSDFDRVEWLNLFSTDRRRRKKGFVQINFE